jgi:hypothetical protein
VGRGLPRLSGLIWFGMVLSSAVVVLEARWPSGRQVARLVALVVRLSSGS